VDTRSLKKTHQDKNPKPGSDSIRIENTLVDMPTTAESGFSQPAKSVIVFQRAGRFKSVNPAVVQPTRVTASLLTTGIFDQKTCTRSGAAIG
jgi:hypothetical protein